MKNAPIKEFSVERLYTYCYTWEKKKKFLRIISFIKEKRDKPNQHGPISYLSLFYPSATCITVICSYYGQITKTHFFCFSSLKILSSTSYTLF